MRVTQAGCVHNPLAPGGKIRQGQHLGFGHRPGTEIQGLEHGVLQICIGEVDWLCPGLNRQDEKHCKAAEASRKIRRGVHNALLIFGPVYSQKHPGCQEPTYC